jgi:hypothetical protein
MYKRDYLLFENIGIISLQRELLWDFGEWKYGLCTQKGANIINRLNYGCDITPFSLVKVKGRFDEKRGLHLSDEV